MASQPPDSPSPSTPGAASSGEHARQVAALSKLAREAAGEGHRTDSAEGQSNLRASARAAPPRVRRAIAVVVVIAVVLGGIGAYLKVHSTGSPRAGLPAMISISVASCGDAPAALAWAPDGKRLAVVSPSASCGPPGQGTPPGMQTASLSVYDARDGTLQSKTSLGSLLGSMANSALLNGVSWSPDGHQLAISVSFNAAATVAPQSLLLVPIQGGQARTVQGTPPFATTQLLWNVQSGAVAGSQVALVPALNYTWSSAGTLTPTQPFPAGGTQTLTGRPTPTHGVSFWQAGQIQPIFLLNASGFPDKSQPPAAEQFGSALALWSPDGQVVAFGLRFQGPVAFSTSPNTQTCAQLDLSAPCASQLLPWPDVAFSNVMRLVAQPVVVPIPGGPPLADYRGAQVAWSPSGKILAAILPADQFNGVEPNHLTETITLFSTASGGRMGTRQYACPAHTSDDCYTPTLLWSPAGDQLALLDTASGVITMWDTHGLGA